MSNYKFWHGFCNQSINQSINQLIVSFVTFYAGRFSVPAFFYLHAICKCGKHFSKIFCELFLRPTRFGGADGVKSECENA